MGKKTEQFASVEFAEIAAPYVWEKSYASDVSWNTPIIDAPLWSLIDDAVVQHGEKPAIDFLGRKYSYTDLGALVDKAAEGFRQIGVRKGIRVGICLPNTPYSVVCYFAVLKAGGTVVNLNPLYVECELEQIAEDAEIKIMVSTDLCQLYPKVARLLEGQLLRTVVICPMIDILPTIKGILFSILQRSKISDIPEDLQHVQFNKLVDNSGLVNTAKVDPVKDIAVLQYTGGTTGLPKGAMLTHANVLANAQQIKHWMTGIDGGDESVLGVIPLFHSFAMTTVMNLSLISGSQMYLLPRFDLKQVLETLAKNKVTLMMGVPTIFIAINGYDDLQDYDLTSLKVCISGGAPLPIAVKQEFEKQTECSLVEGYGLSECSPVVTCNPIGAENKQGSIGLPLPGTVVEIRSPDEEQALKSLGEKGEVCVIGPQVMAGYLGREEATAKSMINGRFHTGDVGYIDEDGYIFLVDRIKDLILCGGYNVYPRVIEEAIQLHEAVEEVTVIGVPDDYRGEAPKAFVKLKPGVALTDNQLLEFLKDRLSPIEMPDFVEFRDELPKTMVGKLSKKELIAEETAKREAKQSIAGLADNKGV
ncbi:long-chain fatty acid--CoA ligase [Alphaproteobacteria bacterium]|nr:long-chain fatty acid--CoA ligase [Alphaproteobacteria bacterium]